jgi:putative tricarboxylic transport membrane protein
MQAHINRRQSLGLIAGASLAPMAWEALAQDSSWKPTEMIRYVIGVAPGGSVDLYARGIKQMLESQQRVNGQTVLADNKPGAAGLLSLQQLQRNRGNAHHLGTFHTGSIAGQATGMLKADMREFVPVAMMVEETSLVAVRADSPLRNVQDLLARLQRDVSSVSFAVAPVRGLNTHLAIAKPLKVAGLAVDKLTVVPFRSSGDSMVALLGGNVDVVSATGPTVMPQVQAGKVRVLASASPQRGTGLMAAVPTWRPITSATTVFCCPVVSMPNKFVFGKTLCVRWLHLPLGKIWSRNPATAPCSRAMWSRTAIWKPSWPRRAPWSPL